jgi:hypothetical protein
MLEGADEIPSILYTNTGNGNFIEEELGFNMDTVISFSNAIGDINNDGFPDIIVNNFDQFRSMLWKNSGGSNHWIKVKLQGTTSNRDGIGAFIHVYSSGSEFMHYTSSAVGFLGQNSSYNMIGLGNTATIDSIKVLWPSGQIDMMNNVSSNQTITIREGSSQLPPRIYSQDRLSICEGDSIVLETGFYDSYLWSNGQTTRSIQIKSPGTYFVQIDDALGSTAYSDTIIIEVLELPVVDIMIEAPDYNEYNGSMEAIVEGGTSPYHYLWSVSGRDTSYVSGIGPGLHTLEVTDQKGCKSVKEVEVNLITGLDTESYSIEIFPNPTDRVLFIRADDQLFEQELSLRLYTFSGSLVESKKIRINDRIMPLPFNVHTLNPGIYILLGTFKNGTFSRKLRID